jgi:hypothetical protein
MRARLLAAEEMPPSSASEPPCTTTAVLPPPSVREMSPAMVLLPARLPMAGWLRLVLLVA